MVSHSDRHFYYTTDHGEVKLPSPGSVVTVALSLLCFAPRVFGFQCLKMRDHWVG